MRTYFVTVVLMGLITLTAYDADAVQMEFVYSELTADGRPIIYLLDVNQSSFRTSSASPEGGGGAFLSC